MNDIIRVFPRRTNMTPDDKLAYIGLPKEPLLVPNLDVYVSVAFTWQIEAAELLAEQWRHIKPDSRVFIGGPAYGHRSGKFVPGRFLKQGITITSRGCPKRCPWCFASTGKHPEELEVKPGYVVQDDNLLACTVAHIEEVFEMLKWQSKGAVFAGGLDIDYLKPWHVELLKSIRLGKSALWVACDTAADLKRLDKAVDLLGDFPAQKKRCYVLLGFNGESIRDAEARCEAVYAKGFMPFGQLYRDERDSIQWSLEWKALARKWSRPAAYNKKGKSND